GADGNTVLETTLTESVISGGRTIKVQSASGYKAGISIAVNGVNYTTQSVNTDTNTITLTAGVSTNLSKGVSVKLNNTVTYQEFYLTAFDVDNANEYADVELYRHGSIVYWDLLPYYSSLSNFYTNKLKTIYDCMRSN
ncbi:MAG TPA: hypothetical protein V6D28_08775, partial [Leptolyngbyaceae cyanobacterium]|nr:hypothetical protein [Nostocaceae cyanobacterium]